MTDEFASDGGAASAGSEEGPGLGSYLNLAIKYAWLIILLGIVGGAVGYYYAQEQDEVFEARSIVLIDLDTPQILREVAPVVDNSIASNFWAKREFMDTQLRIVRSLAVAEEVATRLDLGSDTDFLGLSEISDPVALEAAIEAADAGGLVRARSDIQVVDESTVISIRVRGPSARLAADIANTTAQVYRERNLERQLASTEQAEAWLEEKYATLRTELEDSEEAMVRFRDDNDLIAVTLEEHVGLTAMLDSSTRELVLARRERDRFAAAAEDVEQALDSGDYDEAAIPMLSENALIQSVKSELFSLESQRADLQERGYLENHPEMRSVERRIELASDRLNDEMRHVLQAYLTQSAEATAAVRRLQAELRQVEQEIQELGRHQVAYASLEREADLSRELYAMIERRREEVALTRNSQHNNVAVLEPAVAAGGPVSPNRPLIILAGLLAGLFLGVGTAFLLDVLDGSVKTHDELERDFGLTLLGMLPAMKPKIQATASARGPTRGQKWDPDRFVHQFPRSAVAESARTIRTNLNFLASESPLRSMLVTSPGPREGKTTTTLNMGAVMAQAGTRVLIVDSDLRRPRIHRSFGLDNDKGLSSMLMHGAAGEDVICKTEVENLDILPSGPLPPNPAELLDSPRFAAVLKELMGMYDRVIFDSPPVTPVTDAAIVSGYVDGVVLVVRSGVTMRSLLARTLEQLSAVNADIIGSVMNDVDITRRSTGYYYYYYRHYGEYYGQDEEVSDVA
ncbi:MAG: succinoglycan biosynthesis transport protein ExoP [Bradymonadia bacterium]|jgi:succinoglycan biosynthesis transport protein ExoP